VRFGRINAVELGLAWCVRSAREAPACPPTGGIDDRSIGTGG
jgi:hypothetical protein